MKKEIIEIINIIEDKGFEAYIVGGAARDFYLGKNNSDYDICTNARPRDIASIFLIHEEKLGSMKIDYKGLIIEITTYRKETNYKNRMPKIEYIDSLKDDLLRRDFTINTICINKKLEYIDIYNGINDIKNRIIKTVGDSHIKLKEDPLRILRAIRFSTILDFDIDDYLDKAIKDLNYLVANLTYFRKKVELDKIFSSINNLKGINLLKKYSLDNYLDIDLNNVIAVNNKYAIWAQINYSDKYSFSKKEMKEINIIKSLILKEIGVYELYKYGNDYCKIAIDIKGSNKKLLNISLPITKRDNIDISIDDIKKNSSKNITETYIMIEKSILENKIKNNKSEIIDFIKNI